MKERLGDVLPVVTPPNPTRSSVNREKHDREACKIGRRFYRNRYDVAVDGDCGFPEEIDLPMFDNYPSGCGKEEYRRPDVYAKKGMREKIIEVETKDTINTERTRCQLSTFSENGHTTVYVPEGYSRAMKTQLRRWGITGVDVKEF